MLLEIHLSLRLASTTFLGKRPKRRESEFLTRLHKQKQTTIAKLDFYTKISIQKDEKLETNSIVNHHLLSSINDTSHQMPENNKESRFS